MTPRTPPDPVVSQHIVTVAGKRFYERVVAAAEELRTQAAEEGGSRVAWNEGSPMDRLVREVIDSALTELYVDMSREERTGHQATGLAPLDQEVLRQMADSRVVAPEWAHDATEKLFWEPFESPKAAP